MRASFVSGSSADADATEHSRRYGVPMVKEDLDDGLLRIVGLVEKPTPEDAPSELAAIGGYVVRLELSTSCANKPSAGTSTSPARSI
jgi:UTP-glucose-1-phosphate uridylyltransferase